MTTRLSLIALSLLLSACASPADPYVPDVNSPEVGGDPAESPDAGTEGGFCGGIAGVACDPGLTCRYDGDYPDAGGVCVPE